MGFAKIKGNLSTRIGRRVRFGAPKDVAAKNGGAALGTIIDEVWADKRINSLPPHRHPCKRGSYCWGDYSFCSQLIQWDEPSEDGEISIRLAYFRRRCGENCWEFAGQTTVTSYPQNIRQLLKATLKKDWFKARSG